MAESEGVHMQFIVNDKVVHPIHGAGLITEIAAKSISGEKVECVVIRLMVGNAGVLLPTEVIEDTGLRSVVDSKTLSESLSILSSDSKELPKDWRRRIEALRDRVHSGDPCQVASAVRDVLARSSISKMNPSEKRVLTEAIGVLAGEVALVKEIDVTEARKLIEKLVANQKKS
jgi:CarD family transcriptional regulator